MPPRNLAYNVATVRITPCCNVAIRPENCVLYSPTTWRKKVIISGGKNHTLFQASNSMREINLSPCLDGIIHHLLRTKTDFLCNSKDNALPSSSKAESTTWYKNLLFMSDLWIGAFHPNNMGTHRKLRQRGSQKLLGHYTARLQGRTTAARRLCSMYCDESTPHKRTAHSCPFLHIA